MEKESTRTSLSYEHQRAVRKSGIRKGHESRATPKIISMRNNPKAPRWEKSKAVLGGQQGRSAEVGCARRVHGDRVPASSCITIGPFCRPPLPDTPAAARPQTGLLGSGTGRGKTTGSAEQVGTCQEFNLALLNYPTRLDFAWLPPLPTQHFLGLFSSEMGEKRYGRWENLKHLSEVWVDVSPAVQRSWQGCCQI